MGSGIEVFLAILLVITALYAYTLYRKSNAFKHRYDMALHQKNEVVNFLSIFSKNLNTVEEIESSMNNTARYVSDLIAAESLCIFTLEEDGRLRAAGISGAFPPMHSSSDYVLTKPKYIIESLRKQKIMLGEGLVGQIAESQEPLLIADAASDPMTENLESPVHISTFMGVPMVREGKLYGVICAVNNRLGGSFSPEQFSTLRFISSQVLLTLNIVKVYANLSKQQRINQELEFARQIQASLLPTDFPVWDPFSIYAYSRSAKEVSGDFYDFVVIDENRMLVVIGDACGKGIPACMLMAMTRSFIRSNAARFTTLGRMMTELNRNLYRDTDAERFITIACCLLDKREGTVEYVRAGHTDLLIDVPGHDVRNIFPDGAALGLLPEEYTEKWDSMGFMFLPGMNILIFTDGITEAVNANDEEFGIERLTSLFKECCDKKLSPDESLDYVLKTVNEFCGGTLQADDQTLVMIKHS